MPAKGFHTAYQRISWAEQQIVELRNRTLEFFNSQDYPRTYEKDPKTGYTVDKFKLTGPLPDTFTRISVQIIESLRSSLDHAACAVVPRSAKKATHFPFGDSVRDFRGNLKSKCRHVPKEIQSLFATFKPYKRGTPSLWALNKICNATKHRGIIEPGVFIKEVIFDDSHGVGPPDMLTIPPRWDRRKNEIIVSTSIGKGTIHHDAELVLSIAFGKVPVFQGRPALGGFCKLANISKRIV